MWLPFKSKHDLPPLPPMEQRFWWEAERKWKQACEEERMLEGKRYILHPGYITSRSDGQSHWISAAMLADLYGVHLRDCIVDGPGYRRDTLAKLEHLYPRDDGDYRTEAVRRQDERDRIVKLMSFPYPMFGLSSLDLTDREAEKRQMEKELKRQDELYQKHFGWTGDCLASTTKRRRPVSEIRLPVKFESKAVKGPDGLTDQRLTVRVSKNEGECAKDYLLTPNDTIEFTAWIDGIAVRGPRISVQPAYRWGYDPPRYAISVDRYRSIQRKLDEIKNCLNEVDVGLAKRTLDIVVAELGGIEERP